jgi:hypothetical protein
MPSYIFQRKVIVQQNNVPVVVNNTISNASTPPKKNTDINQIRNIIDINMKNIMINKAHRDQNRYTPKKLL